MKKKPETPNLKSNKHSLLVTLLSLTLIMNGCQDWKVWNQRIHPTYVCEGDQQNVVVTWDYAGPKAKVKITSANNDVLCTSGARVGYCAFDRGLNQSDIPLKVKVYKKDKLKAEFPLFYLVLNGLEETEEFLGTIDWSDPFDKIIYEKRPVYENGKPTGETEQVPVTKQYISADKVKWNLDPTWFTSRVIVESVKYNTGNRSLEIEGPGITRTSFNVGQIRPGNFLHPGGIWYGYFSPALEIPANSTDISTYGLKLNIRCSEN